MGSSIDLRKYQNPESIQDIYSKIVSGKLGYKAIIERKKPIPKCIGCGRGGDEDQKFCSQCGGKMEVPITNCPDCKKTINEGQKFCTECGFSLNQQA